MRFTCSPEFRSPQRRYLTKGCSFEASRTAFEVTSDRLQLLRRIRILNHVATTHVRLLSGSVTYLISNIARAALPFALLPMLTRYLSPLEYGQVAMFQIVVTALAALTGVSVQGAANRKYYDANVSTHELAQYIGSCLQILFVTTLVTSILAFAFRHKLAEWLGLEPIWIFWAVLVSAASFIVSIRLGQWQVRGKALYYGVLQASQSAGEMLVSVLLVVVLLGGAAGRIEAQVWMTPIFAVLSLTMLARDKLVAMAWRPSYLRDAVRFGVPLIPHVTGLFLLSAADRLVINDRLGLADAGIYMVALQLSMVMTLVFDAINKAYVPWLFERLARDHSQDKHQIVRWTYGYFIAALVIAGLAFVVGPYGVTLMAGDEYRRAGRLVGWLALGQAFGGMYLMVTNYVFYSKRTGLLALVTISSGMLNVILLLALIPQHGLIGATWAFTIAMAFRFILTWLVAHKRHPMPWFSSRPL